MNTTPAQIIDEVRGAYSQRLIDRTTAIARIMNAGLRLTSIGAADLLDHERSVSERYSDGGGKSNYIAMRGELDTAWTVARREINT